MAQRILPSRLFATRPKGFQKAWEGQKVVKPVNTLKALLLGLLGCALTLTAHASAVCRGHFINPVTDLCWSCVFPITVGNGIRLPSPKGTLPDPETDASPVCACGRGIKRQVGVNMSFWEPVRTVEIVSEPGCSPSLGGVSLGNPSKAGSGVAVSKKTGKNATSRTTAFYHAHWLVTPWLFLTEALLDSACLETSPFDLAYLTELDPLWNDSIASFVLSPEAALFANPPAQLACTADCTAAQLGLPINTLFWCAGCQGSLYPLTGWVSGLSDPAARWQLLTARFATKLAREALLFSAHGKDGQCGPYFQPILRKDVWRTEIVYPQGAENAGQCCRPFGRSTLLDARVLPPGGSDGAVLLWQRKDCCETANPMSLFTKG